MAGLAIGGIMDRTLRIALVLLAIGAGFARAQVAMIQAGHQPTATVVFEAWPSSNANGSNGWTPTRKQLGNVGLGCSGGVITPTGFPVGQLYATAAIKSAAEAAGCAVQAVVSVTASGTGIAAVDNGNNAGGNDSPLTITDTYGAAGTLCSGDSTYSTIGKLHDLAMPACHANSLLSLAQSTAVGQGNSDVLWPTSYQDTAVDGALYFMRVMHFSPDTVSTLHDWETDTNYNDSLKNYNGWGFHWNKTKAMWEACPQGCSGWKTMKWIPVRGGATVTSYPLTNNHNYMLAVWGHRTADCSSTATVGCYCYDYMSVYDATAGETPKLYQVQDTLGNPICGIPISRPSYPSGLITPQWQIDMTTASASSGVLVDSDDLTFYKMQ